ncbi:MAG: AmmeMemoRadiSam system protein B, partial [Nitrospirota bacterium]
MFSKLIYLTQLSIFCLVLNCFAYPVKQPEFAGQFYPQEKEELSAMVDRFLAKADSKTTSDDIFIIISPHAGYGYSGQTAAFGYKFIRNKPYKTVIILGTSHHKLFNGAAVYASGAFTTGLGKLDIDEEFVKKITGKNPEVFVDESAFNLSSFINTFGSK